MKSVIVIYSSPEKLAEKVTALLAEGWSCHGGVAMSEFDEDWRFAQAMVLLPCIAPA